MCGICGIVDFSSPPDAAAVERMSSLLRHRGPDDEALHVAGDAALGFRRLSIIDLDGGRQPMCNEDGSIWLVFNGEIYNYRDLRALLAGRGHTLRTASDAETILHLYEDHGLDFVQQLNGMFAVALWDARRRRLVLARDRLGVKPLYYALQGRRLAFASETKALLEVPWLRTSLDPEAVAAYMNFSSIPAPMTGFREVLRLPPAHVATFDQAGFTARRYWELPAEDRPVRDPGALLEEIDETVRDAVRLRLIADVPLGVFLSGGVDSSLVAAVAARLSAGPAQVFSIGYGQEGAYHDEIEYARAVARRYGMNHRTLVLEPRDLAREVERVVWFLDEPCGDPAAFLTLQLSEFTRRHVKTALSGIGGDELFGGYRRHAAARYQRRYMRLPRAVRERIVRPLLDLLPEGRTGRLRNAVRLARKLTRPSRPGLKDLWATSVSYLPDYDGPVFAGAMEPVTRDTFASEAFDRHWARAEGLSDPADRAMYMDLHMYLPDQLLLLQDKMSMAASLEAREPLLDHRLVELAWSVPACLKIRGSSLKVLLKRLAERYVPHECIHREKKGFAAPLETWLRGSLRDHVHETLDPRHVRERGIFQVAFVEWLKRGFFGQGRDLMIELYQVYQLETWMRLFVEGRGRPGAQDAPAARQV